MSSVTSKANIELTVSPPPITMNHTPITMGQMTQTQLDEPTQTQRPATFSPSVISPPARPVKIKHERQVDTSSPYSADSDLQYMGTKPPGALRPALSRHKPDCELLYVGTQPPALQPAGVSSRMRSSPRSETSPQRTSETSTPRTHAASNKTRTPQRSAGSERKKKVAKKNNVSPDNNDNCFFCRAPVCHDDLYGPYCIRESRVYLSGLTTRNNIDEQGLFDIYQSTYYAAMKWDMFRTFGSAIERRGLPSLPCCMLNGSFTTCVNLYRSDFH